MTRATCEGCLSIDVRRWHREGRLHEGEHFSYSWIYGEKPQRVAGVPADVEKGGAALLALSR